MRACFQSSIDIREEGDVAKARQHAAVVAQRAGFSDYKKTHLVTIVSELSRNVIKYAGRGRCEFELQLRPVNPFIRVTCRDSGGGIADLKSALEDGYSTSATMGVGLPGVRRLADGFHIQTGDSGTIVEVEIHHRVREDSDA